MELLKKEVNQNITKYKTYMQMTFEDDYVVKDTLPDVGRIISKQASIQIDEKRTVNDSVWINGTIKFEILYVAENALAMLERLEGEIPFQEKVNLTEDGDGDNTSIYPIIEDFDASIINSRKIALRGLAGFEVRVELEKSSPLYLDADIGVPIEKKYGEVDYLNLEKTYKDKVRVIRDVELSKSKENISKIIYCYVNPLNVKCESLGINYEITGDINVCIIYVNDNNQIEWFENVIDFKEELDITQSKSEEDNVICWCKIGRSQGKAVPQMDYDHEYRQFEIELSLDLEIRCYTYNNEQILQDAYSVKGEVELQKEDIALTGLLVKNTAKCRIDERQIVDIKDKILQICGYKADISIEDIKRNPNSLLISGLLLVDMLYISGQEGSWVDCEKMQIPFEQKIDLLEAPSDIEYEIEAWVEHLQLELLDSTSVEIKGNISIATIVFEKKYCQMIEEIEYSEDGPSSDDLAGIIGYVVSDDENLWDIAKAHKTTIRNIEEDNEIDGGSINKGDKILIIKRI